MPTNGESKKAQNSEEANGHENSISRDKENEMSLNLALSHYAHASHLEKLGRFHEGLNSALQSRKFIRKVKLKRTNEHMVDTIENKIDKLRLEVNNKKVYQTNDNLIKRRADFNKSNLRNNQSNNLTLSNTYLVESYAVVQPETYQNPRPRSSNQGEVRGEQSSAKGKSRLPESRVDIGGDKRKSKMKESVLTKKIAGYGKIVKDPYAKINYDPVKFRVTPLYFHDEYFHGNYSNGVEMYRSTCNNQKFHPYHQLNPIPNDKRFLQKSKPTQYKPTKEEFKRLKSGNPSRREMESQNKNEEEDELYQEANELVGDSFEKEPVEVIELDNNPAKTYKITSRRKQPADLRMRPKSAIEMKNKMRNQGKHNTDIVPTSTDDQNAHLNNQKTIQRDARIEKDKNNLDDEF